MPISYDLQPISARSLSANLAADGEATAIGLVRLDERLRRAEPVLAAGFVQRAGLFDAQAMIHLQGELASMEDLILHEAGMDARPPTPAIQRAAAYLAARTSLARRKPDAILSRAGVAVFIGANPDQGDHLWPTSLPPQAKRSGGEGKGGGHELSAAAKTPPTPYPSPPLRGGRGIHRRPPWDDDGEAEDEPDDEGDDGFDPPGDEAIGDDPDARRDAFADVDRLIARSRRALTEFNELDTPRGRATLRLADPAYDATGRLGAWLDALDATSDMPGVLAAAVALDAWLVLEPSEHHGELGFPLAATALRQRQLATVHLPALALGLRREKFRWRPHDSPAARLAGLIAAIGEAARAGMADLDRLTLARELMLRKCDGKRKNSRLPDLIDLFAATPLVTVALAAKKLNVTPQAVDAMLSDLGGSLPRELTGRKRYRAWGIV